MALKLFGYRQRQPWLGYRVVNRLESILKPTWRALEFGSGMSSLFIAKHCGCVVSIETDREWYKRVQELLRDSGVTNVDLRFREEEVSAMIEDVELFDFVLVDGVTRDASMATAIRRCKPGGWILFDNSDVQWAEHQAARSMLLSAASHIEVYNDLYPFALQVCESILARMPQS
jgi:predicted O-methyltransferase YrrM